MRASTDGPLNPLILIPSDAVPTARREAHERATKSRREAIGRAFSCGAMFGLCAIFCLSYGGLSAFAWMNHGHPLFGIVMSIFCGITFLGSGHLGHQLATHVRQVVSVPDLLRRQAETEAALEEARRDVNFKATFWNEASRAALDVEGIGGVFVINLLRQRIAIAQRQREFRDGLDRFLAATGPKVRIVPQLHPWGHAERVTLDDQTL